MIHFLRKVLSADELARLRDMARDVRMVGGSVTNPGSQVKNNLQTPQNDPSANAPSLLLRDALMRHEDIRRLALPRNMARPTLAFYKPEMNYGWHVDEALFPSQPPMRSDLSCTVFINEPDSYEGGELEMEFGSERHRYKLPAGDAILYPSTTIHQVLPVISGERLVGLTWIQSYVADAHQRALLIQIAEARAIDHARGADARMQVLLESLRTNLLRMWSDG